MRWLLPNGCRIGALREWADFVCSLYRQTFSRTRLAVFYPYTLGLLLLPAPFAGITLNAIIALVLLWHRQRPHLTWYLVTLVLLIGLMLTEKQARGDRCTYIPIIGPTIALLWGISPLEP